MWIVDLTNYRLSLSSYLADIPIPHETLVCRDFTCCNAEHGRAIQGCYQYFPKVSPIFDIDAGFKSIVDNDIDTLP